MGCTNDPSFPTTASAAFPTTSTRENDFFSVINPTGSGLVYSTFLPDGTTGVDGSGWTLGTPGGIAVDIQGNAYITGAALPGFQTTAGAFQSVYPGLAGNAAPFLAKVNPSLSGTASLVYSTYLGGTNGALGDAGTGIAVDSAGNAYVTGWATSTDFPTTAGAYQRTGGGGFGTAFVAKLNPSLSGSALLVYSTYLGNADGYISQLPGVIDNNEQKDSPAIAVDSAGNVYIAGQTNSSTFPTTPGAFQTKISSSSGKNALSNYDAFISKLNATGSALVYSTYLGGNNEDCAVGIALDSQNNAYVTGVTRSSNFPVVNPLQKQLARGTNPNNGAPTGDVFVTTLNASGSALLFSTYFGGTGEDYGNGIAVNAAGDAYVTGSTGSSNFPTTAGAYQRTSGGGFAFMIDPPVDGTSPRSSRPPESSIVAALLPMPDSGSIDQPSPPAWNSGSVNQGRTNTGSITLSRSHERPSASEGARAVTGHAAKRAADALDTFWENWQIENAI
jgi:hypothetical protein